jgi:signal transduction histidine kinase
MRWERTRAGSRSLSVAAAAAGLSVGWSLLAGLVEASAGWHGLLWFAFSVPPGFETACVGVSLLALGAWLGSRSSDDAAFSCFALAAAAAGAAALAVADSELGSWQGSDAAMGPVVPMLAAYAGLFVLSAVVLGAWALAPGRRLGPWVGPFAIACVAVTLVGGFARAMGYWTVHTRGVLSVTGPDVSVVWRSGLLLAILALVAVAGAVRAAARRRLAADVASRRVGQPADDGRRSFSIVGGIAVAAWIVCAGARIGHGREVDALPPLLWLLVAAVALRWSRAAAWAALAVSLVLSGGVLVAPGLDAAGQPLDTGVLASLVAGWVALAIAVFSGWRALASVTHRAAERRLAWALTIVALVLPLAMVASGGASDLRLVWWPEPGNPVPDLWMPVLVIAPVVVAFGIALGNRLVDAVAEAEADAEASGGIVASRYLAVAGVELAGGQARVRAMAAEAERHRLASELHAEVLPVLARTSAEVAASGPTELADDLRSLETELRGLLDQRRHVILEEFGLVPALEWLAERAQKQGHCPVDLTVDEATTDERPPRPVERAAFRVAQLAFDNALRHAHPSAVCIGVLARFDQVSVSIADDGLGIAATTSGGASGRRGGAPAGYGLIDMQNQAAQVRGKVRVTSPGSTGTTVRFDWPAAAAAHEVNRSRHGW